MPSKTLDFVWLDARETLNAQDLCRVCGLSLDELDELLSYGLIAPLDVSPPAPAFSADCVIRLRTVTRLRRDFELDMFAAAMLAACLARIEALEHDVTALQAAMPGPG